MFCPRQASPFGPRFNDEPNRLDRSSVYSKLPEPRSIRLLAILPSKLGSIIESELEIVDLDGKPRYEELSYIRGATSPGCVSCSFVVGAMKGDKVEIKYTCHVLH